MDMIRGRVGTLALVCLLLALAPAGARAGEASGPAAQGGAERDSKVPEAKPPVSEVITRALKLALEARGLTIAEGSLESGQVTTAYLPLPAEMIPKATRAGRGAPERAWARAEYRHHARLGGANRTALRLKAEIRVWPTEPAGDGAGPGPASAIASSGHLEREFLKSFREAVVSLNHLFPDEEPEEGKAKTSTGEAGVEAADAVRDLPR